MKIPKELDKETLDSIVDVAKAMAGRHRGVIVIVLTQVDAENCVSACQIGANMGKQSIIEVLDVAGKTLQEK